MSKLKMYKNGIGINHKDFEGKAKIIRKPDRGMCFILVQKFILICLVSKPIKNEAPSLPAASYLKNGKN